MPTSILTRTRHISPAEVWSEIMRSDLNERDMYQRLQQVYRDHLPEVGELIFTGACEFTCQHCIYDPSFARFNRTMDLEGWRRVVGKLVGELGIKTFVYGGRSVTPKGIQLLAWIRRTYPDARIGLIDNGISSMPYRDELRDLDLDWIDISLDGLEKDHDLQRGRLGSYRQGLEGAQWLMEHSVTPKVNISTCLTTLNHGSVINMIEELNSRGVKNFFVIPVTVVPDVRPDQSLVPSDDELVQFIAKLQDRISYLDDAWVEVNLYMPEYLEGVLRYLPEVGSGMEPEDTHLRYSEVRGNSIFSVRYYPVSLTGTQEFLVNTNGDVLLPKAMTKGHVDAEAIVGNANRDSVSSIVDSLINGTRFSYYFSEMVHEKRTLRGLENAICK